MSIPQPPRQQPSQIDPLATQKAYFVIACLAPYAPFLWALGEWGMGIFALGIMALLAGLGLSWRRLLQHYVEKSGKPFTPQPTLGAGWPIPPMLELGKWVFWIGIIGTVTGVPLLTVLNGLYGSESSFIQSFVVIPLIIPICGVLVIIYSLLQAKLMKSAQH